MEREERGCYKNTFRFYSFHHSYLPNGFLFSELRSIFVHIYLVAVLRNLSLSIFEQKIDTSKNVTQTDVSKRKVTSSVRAR